MMKLEINPARISQGCHQRPKLCDGNISGSTHDYSNWIETANTALYCAERMGKRVLPMYFNVRGGAEKDDSDENGQYTFDLIIRSHEKESNEGAEFEKAYQNSALRAFMRQLRSRRNQKKAATVNYMGGGNGTKGFSGTFYPAEHPNPAELVFNKY